METPGHVTIEQAVLDLVEAVEIVLNNVGEDGVVDSEYIDELTRSYEQYENVRLGRTKCER